MVDLSGTFDTTNALSSMYLWLIFGFMSALLNCDLQRMIQNNPLMMHAFGLTAFFFLFTVLDSKNNNSVLNIWLKTMFIYVLFILMTKSKWYFIIPVLALLLVDQSIKKDILFRNDRGEDVVAYKKTQEWLTYVINNIIIFIIIIGTIHYAYIQKKEYGSRFSWFTFFLGWTKCKSRTPK
jgi:hypothetical protein